MDKPFLTIDEQIELLKSRGVEPNNDTYRLLLCEGYYSLINGYKDPFLDSEKTKLASDDRYKEGTTFEDIYRLFKFDRELRSVTFHYLTKIEVMIRTICCYTFCENHQKENAYLDINNFSEAKDYMPGEQYFISDFSKFQSKLNFIIQGKTKFNFVEHYRNKYDNVPLWVIANAMTFGNVEHLYDLMKPNEQNKACSRIIRTIGKEHSSEKLMSRQDLRKYLNNLVKIRNICAHDERLYCASVYGRNQSRYIDIMDMAIELLSEEDVNEFALKLAEIIITYSEENKIIQSTLYDNGLIQFASRWIRQQGDES